MLSVQGITKFYGEKKAVDNVSFDIKQGEIIGLLGQNGAGKTTMMKMLSGFLETDQGTITFLGHDINQKLKLLQQKIGYLPENLPVYPELTVIDYLDYMADLKGLTSNKYKQIKQAVEATELMAKLDAPISTLSRGFKQRVGVAQAVLGEPKLLILDEPTNGLDPTQTEHMRNLIKTLAQNATVILSTHIMQEVEAMCDRVLIIKDGQLAIDTPLHALEQSNHIRVSTNLNREGMEQLINQFDCFNIVGTKALEQGMCYQLACTESLTQNIQHQLAKAIIISEHELYALEPVQRDLASIFKEIYQTPYNAEVGGRNAA